MQDCSASSTFGFKMVKHGRGRATTMNGEGPAARLLAELQDTTEDQDLVGPMRSKLRGSIETDFADILGFGQKALKQGEFRFALVDQLWMQSERRPDAAPVRRAQPYHSRRKVS